MSKISTVTAHYSSHRQRFIIDIDGYAYQIVAKNISDAIEMARRAHEQN